MKILKVMLFQLLIIIPFVLVGLASISLGAYDIVGVFFMLLGVVYSATFGTRKLLELEENNE